MQTRFIILIYILCSHLLIGCSRRQPNLTCLPECEVVYNAYEISYTDLLRNGRPKVVVHNNMLSKDISAVTLFNDVALLKKQIEEFPEFDFIYYFPVAINYNEQIRSIAQENNLKIVAIIDSNNSFGEINKLSKKVIASAMIFDENLKPHFSAIPGVSFSPFNNEIIKYKTRLK